MPERAFTVRRAVPADVPVLVRHRVEMFRDMGRLKDDEAAAVLREVAEPAIRSWLESGAYLGWLAAPAGHDADIIGGAGLQLRPMLPRPRLDGAGVVLGPEAYVMNVYVEKLWRRKGVAALLMERVLEYARGAGLAVVTLHASDEGRSLYARLGFAPTNEMRLR
ncbi:MAG: GNAT family N-acetyltransferase [Gemmatimonadales bacterium]